MGPFANRPRRSPGTRPPPAGSAPAPGAGPPPALSNPGQVRTVPTIAGPPSWRSLFFTILAIQQIRPSLAPARAYCAENSARSDHIRRQVVIDQRPSRRRRLQLSRPTRGSLPIEPGRRWRCRLCPGTPASVGRPLPPAAPLVPCRWSALHCAASRSPLPPVTTRRPSRSALLATVGGIGAAMPGTVEPAAGPESVSTPGARR